MNERSSSVNWPYFCFNFPFTSFQLPLTCNFVVITKRITLARRRLVACKSAGAALGHRASWAARLKSAKGRELLLDQKAILAERTSAGVTTSYSAGPELEKLSMKETVAPSARYRTGVQLTFAPTSKSKSVRDDLMGSLV